MAETLHPEEAVTSFLLIRHGHTVQTESGKLYSDPAAVLTEKGQEEAKAAAAWLQNESPEVLLCSPSVRARASAEAIAQSGSLKAQIVDSLKEWQVGSWEGRSYIEIKKEEPEIYVEWLKDPIRNAPPGGESLADLCSRAMDDVYKLCALHESKKVVLVTHAEVIRAILVNALGMPVDNFYRLNIPTASVTKLDVSKHFCTMQYMALKP